MIKNYLIIFFILLSPVIYAQNSPKSQIKKAKSIFESKPIVNGHSWTITSRLGNILKIAEEEYGKRDYSYTILGIEITNQNKPQIWYPGNRKHIIIQITESCFYDMKQAVYQIAHEAIHCLSPTGSSYSNVLEEGLATYFAREYCASIGLGNIESTSPEYKKALTFVEKLLKIDPDIIKTIRENQPTLAFVSKDDFIKANPNIPEELIDELLKKF